MTECIIASEDARPTAPDDGSPAESEVVRAKLASIACYEIQLLARAVQRFIEGEDDAGKICPVTRGMMLRISDLSDAIAGAHDTDEDICHVEEKVYGKEYQR